MIRIIHDGDHGGDDFITSLLFMAYPEEFDLLGITTTLGNTNAVQASINALKTVHIAKRRDVPVHQGANQPFKIEYRLGDDAFGGDGLGGIEFDLENELPHSRDAITWMADQLRFTESPITICATGPLTNIAHLLTDFPDIHSKIEKIVIMGGGTNPAGNIKPYAEFNFYMDPDAADLVLNSGVPIVLHTLNTTQTAIYTKARQQKLKSVLSGDMAGKFDAVMRITEDLEKKAFGSEGAFFHDHQVCAFLAMPENYETKKFKARVIWDPDQEAGRLLLEPDESSNLSVAVNIKDTDKMFDFVLEGLRRVSV